MHDAFRKTFAFIMPSLVSAYARLQPDGLPDGADNQTLVGFNAGGGAEFFVAPQLKLNLEIKYQYAEKEKTYARSGGTEYVVKYEAEGPVFQAGFAYCF